MPKINHAVIAAAGLGSRLGAHLPKAMIPVLGHSIIEYQLNLLKDFDKVTVIVGYKAEELIQLAGRFRSDIRFIRNSEYDKTTTLQSYYLGIKDIEEDHFVLLDGVLIVSKDDFTAFLRTSETCNALICVAKAGAEYGVFADCTADFVCRNIGNIKSGAYEWANLAYLPVSYFEDRPTFVYEQLNQFMPMKALLIDCLEIDSEADLNHAEYVMARDGKYRLPLTQQRFKEFSRS
jgi:GTP:adenosylcobinamide-phosphate guanylyltransferase